MIFDLRLILILETDIYRFKESAKIYLCCVVGTWHVLNYPCIRQEESAAIVLSFYLLSEVRFSRLFFSQQDGMVKCTSASPGIKK